MKYLTLLLFCGLMVIQNTIGQIQECIEPEIFEIKADSLFQAFRYDSSAVYYCKAASVYEQKRDWMHCVKNYRLTSNAFLKTAKYDSAFDYSQKAFSISLKHFQENNKDEMYEKSDILLCLGNVTEMKGKYQEELLYYKKALDLVLTTDRTDSLKIAEIWNKAGAAYNK